MDSTVFERIYTFEEYWELELHSVERHEFVNGKILIVPGVTQKHNFITINLGVAFMSALKNSSFLVFTASVKLEIEPKKD